MIRRATLYALDQAAEAGAPEGARRALAKVDPIVRLLATRRARAAQRSAGSLSSVQDEAHLTRLAFLLEASRDNPAAEFDDVEAVTAERGELRKVVRAPRRGPWVVGAIALVLAVGAALAVALPILLKPFHPRSLPGGPVFADHVPSHVVAVSRGDVGGAGAAREAALGSDAKAALGDDAVAALGALLDATESLARAKPPDQEPASQRYVAAAATLNRSLEKTASPFFVDADALGRRGRTMPILLTFYVQREMSARSGDTTVRCVHLRRLDDINLRQGYLGYTRPTMPAAVVLLDQIETELVRLVLPALPEDELMDMVDVETEVEGHAWTKELARAGADAVRKHYAAMPDEHKVGVGRVGKLVARRRALVKSWRKTIGELGMLLKPPRRLVPEADYAEELSLKVPRAQLYEWDDLHDELLSSDTFAAFRRLRDRYVTSVERHEVQHRLDYARGALPYPETLARLLPTDSPLAIAPGTLRGRSRAELSAFLVEIAESPDSPLLDLVLLARFAFDRGSLGGPYSYAAIAAMDGIAAELGIDFWSIVGRRIRRENVAQAFREIVRRPPDAIRQAARKAYEKAFEQPIPSVTLKHVKSNEEWLH